MEPFDKEVGLTTVRPDVPLGPLTPGESRAIAHAFAKAQERKAYELLKKAEAHLAACVDHWNECQTQMHATAPEN